jgi:hypothetical protein
VDFSIGVGAGARDALLGDIDFFGSLINSLGDASNWKAAGEHLQWLSGFANPITAAERFIEANTELLKLSDASRQDGGEDSVRSRSGRNTSLGVRAGIWQDGANCYNESMIEFKYSGEQLYARMERAVEKVNDRLQRTVRIIETAEIPYAVVGGFAVRAWVAQVDEAAVRTTRDVDILVRESDLPALIRAMSNAGFCHRQTSGLDMFVEHPDASARDAVHVLISGRVEKTGDPNPDVEPSTETTGFRTIPLRTLVAMKLNANRDKDRVHLRDMISLNMIDRSWLDYYPERLRLRLQELLDDPDG